MSSRETTPTERNPLLPRDEEGNHPAESEEGDIQTLPSLVEDAWDTLLIGVPIFISRLSFVGMKTTDSALLGHVSQEALSASALSDLWTMCSQVLINGRILGVLVGGAVGAGNPKLAGIYLQVSLVILSGLAVIVFIAWNMTEFVWLKFGSDPQISQMAGYYASTLSSAIPAILIFGQLSQFFSAQRIMHPEVVSASVGLALNLVLGLVFVLGFPIPGFNGYQFWACPIVTASVSYFGLFTLFVVYIWIQQLHAPAWGGWNWNEVTWDRIATFCKLYFPAAMSSASDFWRVGVIGAMAARLGEVEVAVIMWIALTMVGALAGASAINMTMRLGKNDPYGARQAGYVGIALSTFILVLVSAGILIRSDWFGRIFTNDEEFLTMFDECSLPFTLTLFFMNFSVTVEVVLYSMGRTSELFWMGFVASWFGQVPGVFLLTTYWRSDLVGLYSGMALGYFGLCILYGALALRSDWVEQARLAQTRSETSNKEEN
eukprot:Nitzschia sp. Nitz4//scaffold378_size14206//7680//9369//NITZ4_008950-RA/size14206-snap-gene-0.7-mRNA-1//1//CDS//3329549696//5488//frame0